jgi:transcriptional regulator with GAF, ATPase, and Fis domain
MRAMVGYDWPGNVRELQNLIERSVIRSGSSKLWAPIDELTNKAIPAPSVYSLADADRAHIVSTLHQTNWVIGGRNGVAVRLGLKRTTLIANMRKLGVHATAKISALTAAMLRLIRCPKGESGRAGPRVLHVRWGERPRVL